MFFLDRPHRPGICLYFASICFMSCHNVFDISYYAMSCRIILGHVIVCHINHISCFNLWLCIIFNMMYMYVYCIGLCFLFADHAIVRIQFSQFTCLLLWRVFTYCILVYYLFMLLFVCVYIFYWNTYICYIIYIL